MCGYPSNAPASDLDDGHMPFISVIPRAIHRAGQVAFQGSVGPIRLLDAALLTSSSRGKAILHIPEHVRSAGDVEIVHL